MTRLISSGGLKALLSSPGMGEAIEEGAASLAGFLADVLLMRENSEFSRRVTEYEDGGKTRNGAIANAAWDTLEDILYDSLAGGLSGEAHAGIAKVWSAVSKALGDKGKTSNAGTQEKAPSNATMPYGGPGPRTKPPITDTMAKADIRDGDTSVPSRVEAPKTTQPEGDVPYFTSDHWTGELEGLWTENTADTVDTRAVDRQQPMRYEDALREYVGRETEHSRDPVTPQTAVPAQGSPVIDEGTQRTVQSPKDQVIGELVPKLQKPGITPGRAMIAAQETYADAEKRFGPDAQAVLESYQPGQDPKRFLDGFQNAYLAGMMGSSVALNNSSAVAYLTQEQREVAYELGEEVEQHHLDIWERRDIMGMYRDTRNGGAFAELPERMTKKHIREIAREYGISLKGVTLLIDNNVELLGLMCTGVADPSRLGRVIFLPNAFCSKEMLVRTLYHELIHVEQFRKYGTEYVQNNRAYFEGQAYDAEERFIDRMKKEGRL